MNRVTAVISGIKIRRFITIIRVIRLIPNISIIRVRRFIRSFGLFEFLGL